MKGVIMAGGKGTRLRPLTCNIPKPMVPLIHKPVMEYSIELLKKHGITEIAITLQYLPDTIKNYFGDGKRYGINIHYFEEKVPLGTAGSIKHAEEFLDESFIVMSGDCITDFNLSEGIAFHKNKQALTTIFMKKVKAPMEYGVILTNESSKVIRYREKPTWSELFSNMVNTGIYVFEPEIFSFIEPNVCLDFSKDVFPILLKDNIGVYGYEASGYWADIGTIDSYRQTQFDMLDQKIQVQLPGKEIEQGIWIGEDITIEDEVTLNKPVSIGNGVVIRNGAMVDSYSIVGAHSTLSTACSMKHSILWNDVFVGDASELRGTTVCKGTQIESNVSFFEASVIGEQCKIEANAIIKPKVKVWPNKGIGKRRYTYAEAKD